MKTIYTLAWAGMLVAAPLMFAQTPGARLPTPAAPTAIDPTTGLPTAHKADPEPTFDLDFPGGKPKDLLEAIQKQSNRRPNVIIQPECLNIDIPKFQLRDISISQIFYALNGVLDGEKAGTWRPSTGSGGIWLLSKEFQYVPGMTQLPRFQNSPKEKPAKLCRIFNLGPFLGEFKVEDITTAVHGAWELMNVPEMPAIKYHKDTKLLIVVGENDQINIVNEVLMQLRAGLKPPGEPTEKPAPEKPAQKKL